MFTQAYLQTAASLLHAYRSGEPFHLYLKHFFTQQKKYGARDRRHIAQLCYCWLRVGHAVQHLDEKAQFAYALFLCTSGGNKLLEKLDADLHQTVTKSRDEKLVLAQERAGIELQHFFPWAEEVSAEIDKTAFFKSHLIQPDLFLRLRPGRERFVTTALHDRNIAFEIISANCIALGNSTAVDPVITLDKDAVVQDRSSQQVLTLLHEHGFLKKFTAWDCCAASGGKSLLLLDTFSNAHITVSDIRETIMHNLRARFKRAGITNYRWAVADAATGAPPGHQPFDLIICDAPCTGSGTWSRTPEQLHHFAPEKIAQYAQLQQRIVTNVSRHLKPGGFLFYITCSVFRCENEEVVAHIKKHTRLNFLKSAYVTGYGQKADTLFAALFRAS